MEKESGGELRRGERGSALSVVLLMLLLLLPLSLILGRFVMRWQGEAASFHQMTGLEYVARSGFEDAIRRLATEGIRLDSNQSTEFELTGVGVAPAQVHVSRQTDAVVSLDGRVLEGIEAAEADLDEMAVDPDLRRVHAFRNLEVYLVEVTVAGPSSLAGVRLRGAVVRADGGTWRRAGLRVDRGYF